MQFPDLPQFLQLTVGTPATTNVLIILFLIIFIIWIIHAAVSVYHWRNYSNDKGKLFFTQFYYFVGSAVLFCTLISCVAYYSLAGS